MLLTMSRLSLLAGLIGISVSVVQADEDISHSTAAVDLVITATRSERPARGAPVSVTVAGRRDLREAPALLPDNLLRNVPGLNIPGTNSAVSHLTSSQLSARGIGGSRMLIMEDGVPLNHSFGGWINWRRIPLDAVDRIEVARGGASSLFGNYAMGGVVNVVTRDPNFRSLELGAGAGTFDTRGYTFYASESVGRWGVGASGNQYQTDGYNTVHPDQRAPIFGRAGGKHLNGHFKTLFRASENTEWNFKSSYFEGDQNLGTPLNNNTLRNTLFSVGVKSKVTAIDELRGVVYTQADEFKTTNTELSPALDAETVADVHDTPSRDSGASVQWSHSLPGRLRFLLFGAEGRLTKGTDRERRFDSAGNSTLERETEGHQRTSAIFTEAGFYPTDPLELLISARLDHWQNLDGRRATSGAPTTEFPDRSDTEFSPRLAARYQFTGPWAVRAAAYRSFRQPTIDELYREKSFAGLTFGSNPHLLPEILRGAEAGFDLTTQLAVLRITGFWNEITDPVTFVFAPPFSFVRENVGETRSRGVESILDVFLSPHWTASASHVYAEALITEFETNPSLVGHRVPDVPRNTLTGSLRFRDLRRCTVLVRGRYLSSQIADTSNTDETGSHTVFDASLTFAVTRHWELFGIVENLFDRRYLARKIGGFGIVGAPLQVFAGVRYRCGE